MQGTVLSVAVVVGQEVAVGEVLCIIEAMKMENEVTAHTAGAITAVSIEAGQSVAADEIIAVIG
jgi:acetyl-CoA/propionyl-CoA carboxylase biotin carboxyl carrier protein